MKGWNLETHAILPLIYDEALSYSEQVANLRFKVNEITKKVTAILVFINDWEGSLDSIQTILEELEKKTNSLDSDIIDIRKELEEMNRSLLTLSNTVGQHQSEIQEIKLIIDQIKIEINSFYFEMKLLIENKMLRVKKDLEDFIIDQLSLRNGETLIVRNPLTGKIETLNRTLKEIINFVQRLGGITKKEYRKVNITQEQYREMEIIFINYNISAKFIFFQKLTADWINEVIEKRITLLENKIKKYYVTIMDDLYGINSLTGRYESVKSMINFLNKKFINSITQESYRNWNLTEEQYRNVKLTIRNYNEKSIFIKWFEQFFNSNINIKIITFTDETLIYLNIKPEEIENDIQAKLPDGYEFIFNYTGEGYIVKIENGDLIISKTQNSEDLVIKIKAINNNSIWRNK